MYNRLNNYLCHLHILWGWGRGTSHLLTINLEAAGGLDPLSISGRHLQFTKRCLSTITLQSEATKLWLSTGALFFVCLIFFRNEGVPNAQCLHRNLAFVGCVRQAACLFFHGRGFEILVIILLVWFLNLIEIRYTAYTALESLTEWDLFSWAIFVIWNFFQG